MESNLDFEKLYKAHAKARRTENQTERPVQTDLRHTRLLREECLTATAAASVSTAEYGGNFSRFDYLRDRIRWPLLQTQ